jgi:hypothetical protein
MKDYKLKLRNLHTSHTLGWSYPCSCVRESFVCMYFVLIFGTHWFVLFREPSKVTKRVTTREWDVRETMMKICTQLFFFLPSRKFLGRAKYSKRQKIWGQTL